MFNQTEYDYDQNMWEVQTLLNDLILLSHMEDIYDENLSDTPKEVLYLIAGEEGFNPIEAIKNAAIKLKDTLKNAFSRDKKVEEDISNKNKKTNEAKEAFLQKRATIDTALRKADPKDKQAMLQAIDKVYKTYKFEHTPDKVLFSKFVKNANEYLSKVGNGDLHKKLSDHIDKVLSADVLEKKVPVPNFDVREFVSEDIVRSLTQLNLAVKRNGGNLVAKGKLSDVYRKNATMAECGWSSNLSIDEFASIVGNSIFDNAGKIAVKNAEIRNKLMQSVDKVAAAKNNKIMTTLGFVQSLTVILGLLNKDILDRVVSTTTEYTKRTEYIAERARKSQQGLFSRIIEATNKK